MATSIKSVNRSGLLGFARGAQSRYIDAYRVAGTVGMFGQAIKVAGAVLAVVIFVRISDLSPSPGTAIIAAVSVGSLFFVIGVLIAAHGQLLRATLDTAVNSSPFLNSREKAAIMSLKSRDGSGDIADSDVPSFTDRSEASAQFPLPSLNGARGGDDVEVDEQGDDTASSPFCCHCGAEVRADATLCTACGKRL